MGCFLLILFYSFCRCYSGGPVFSVAVVLAGFSFAGIYFVVVDAFLRWIR
ncbi:hypothetical protein A2U01_0076700, partial [Trifolium medium]|nr:hypothetical protein [Trifolium medium]